MKETARYFIAIIPEEPTCSAVNNIKLEFAELYKSKGSLRSPPHITLHMPFQLKEKYENDLKISIEQIAKYQTAFTLNLNGFGHFNERVIYLQVQNSDQIQSLYQNVCGALKIHHQLFNSDYKNRGFNPHMTVAFRDLKREMFKKAWSVYSQKEFETTLQVNHLSVLKHNGKIWQEHYRIPFC